MLSGALPREEYCDGLSRREVEVLTLLAGGMANRRIADELRISERTVRNHINQKLNICNRTEATLYALRQSLIQA